MNKENIEKLASIKVKIIKTNTDNNKQDEVISNKSSERQQDSQAGINLEKRVNNNMGVHSQKSE